MSRMMRIKSTKTLPTYTRLRGTSWYALEVAKESEKGRFHWCMTAMLFSAFCLEAYLNHLGARHIGFWEPLKRKLGPQEKLEVLTTVLGFKPDFGERPYQTFKSIFRLRDLLVHAKSETLTLEGDFVLDPGEMPPEPLAEWEQLISLEGAERFVNDTKAIVQDLGSRSGIEETSVFEPETTTWTGTYLRDDASPSS